MRRGEVFRGRWRWWCEDEEWVREDGWELVTLSPLFEVERLLSSCGGGEEGPCQAKGRRRALCWVLGR